MTPAAAPFARTPEPPYYAVVFTSQRTEEDRGYGAMSDAMARLALEQPGCLGAESARDADGFGITVSYWRAEADILACVPAPDSETPMLILCGDCRG